MLSTMSSLEISEWKAYFKIKEKKEKSQPTGKANKNATLG